MKILVLPSWYPSDSYPNNGIFFKEQTEALKDAGIDVTVLCIDIPYRKTKKDYKYFRKNTYIENGVTIYRYVYPFGFLHRIPKLYYCFLNFIAKRIYRKELQLQQNDIILAHSFLIGGYVAICLKKIFGIKCVVIEHSSKILRNDLNACEKDVLKECVEMSDGFVCVSNNLRSHVQKITNTKKDIWVHPNMVSSLFGNYKKDNDIFRFSSVGNLIALKRMDYLIEAFCKAFSREENVRLDIMGDGPEKEKLRRIIKENNREQQIILHGLLEREKVAQVLEQSHVMALLSEKETFGIAYIEALACGNVVIGTDNGGANDIITSSNGIFLEHFSLEEIAKALRNVYEHINEYDIDNISKTTLEKYGSNRFAEDYITFLNERLNCV